MAWEFAALPRGEPPDAFAWVWRIISDDDGKTLRQSVEFASLSSCIEDARKQGYVDTGWTALHKFG